MGSRYLTTMATIPRGIKSSAICRPSVSVQTTPYPPPGASAGRRPLPCTTTGCHEGRRQEFCQRTRQHRIGYASSSRHCNTSNTFHFSTRSLIVRQRLLIPWVPQVGFLVGEQIPLPVLTKTSLAFQRWRLPKRKGCAFTPDRTANERTMPRSRLPQHGGTIDE